jgi:tetratricopeptide (TPR) repeat protein
VTTGKAALRVVKVTIALWAAIVLLATASAAEVTRSQAVQQLSSPDTSMRREAIARLRDVGAMEDATALVRVLRDSDPQVREHAEQAIWQIWSRSGNPQVDALYQAGIRQMEAGDLPDAIATFSRIIALDPSFAEGWNKRATLYFMAGDLRKSLADCDEVVKRNPLHFGALAGYAQIYGQLDYYERALEYARRALAVNPNLDGIRRYAEMLEQMLERRQRKTI